MYPHLDLNTVDTIFCMLSIRYTHVPSGITLHVSSKLFQRWNLLIGSFLYEPSLFFNSIHKSSIKLRSGECGDHSRTSSSFFQTIFEPILTCVWDSCPDGTRSYYSSICSTRAFASTRLQGCTYIAQY